MREDLIKGTIIALLAIGLAGCSGDDDAGPGPGTEETAAPAGGTAEQPAPQPTSVLDYPEGVFVANPESSARRNAYYGDLHIHTTYSFDAFAFGTVATPYDAYRFAMGEPLKHPSGYEMQLKRPLDFYAVTDHAMFLGNAKAAADTTTELSKLPALEFMHNLNAPENRVPGSTPRRSKGFSSFLGAVLDAIDKGLIDVDVPNKIVHAAWVDSIAAAEQYNRPGKFTTFVAYEYTSSSDDRGNLHRNVFFKDADKLPGIPFSRLHSRDPEALWNWMDDLREQGIEALAIPHNSNGSNGQMFKLVDWAGDPLDDDYANKRMRNEPLIEITQIKGTSETHPLLSPNDEWAGFEIMPYRIATSLYSEPVGSYAREALLNGLTFQDKGMENPFKFGFVGASDNHIGAFSDDESNFFGKIGLLDTGDGAARGSIPLSEEEGKAALKSTPNGVKELDGKVYRDGSQITWGASGYAAVWAEENTREAIYNAFRRKETFATSGTRIKVRIFGGYGFESSMLDSRDVFAQAYRDGVSMGSDLLADGDKVPVFLVWAVRDTLSAPLQRVQIIKGWTEDGTPHEQVYDVACSDGLKVDPQTHRCPDNGATVDLANCAISKGSGAAELKTVWKDPDFNPAHRAFYYVRALENPTCRWSTWDAIRAGVKPRPDYPATIQERAWSSPIWYVPEA
ncbi:MAG: DUF3604 domain-containing protein [Pseudomonadota bacterium]